MRTAPRILGPAAGVAVLSAALLCSCGAKTPTEVEIGIVPDAVSVIVYRSSPFVATVRNADDRSVRWSLAGDGCNGASCGTLSELGLYTAPASIPNPATVTVTATSVADPSKSASAIVTILPEPVVSDQWTWISGGDLFRGTPGPSVGPGTRVGSAGWSASDGTLWLFGGGTGTWQNDLWRYDPAVDLWTWVAGSKKFNEAGTYGVRGQAEAANRPGARSGSTAWSDAAGSFWLLGGFGYDAQGDLGQLNDLWRYDRGSGLWTWMAGSDKRWSPSVYGTKGVPDPLNGPGGRDGQVSWTDPEGKFWVFGGEGFDSTPEELFGLFNDLWMFDPGSGQWTWIAGTSLVNRAGVYGLKGVAGDTNCPGGRMYATSWTDVNGRLWLFGGFSRDPDQRNGKLNDLWVFDRNSRLWTWISGSDLPDQFGVYGSLGVSSPENAPGARAKTLSWVDPDGRFWIFGGAGLASLDQGGGLNDLWRFDPATREWTWVSGSKGPDDIGSYGSRHVADPMNRPPSRWEALAWLGADGNLWLYGGLGAWWSEHLSSDLGDLWRYSR